MKQRLQFTAFVVGFLVLACGVSWHGGEPRWEGRTVSQWVVELGRLAQVDGLGPPSADWAEELAMLERRRKPGRDAIRNIGPAAVPYILRQLQLEGRPPSRLQEALANLGWNWFQPPSEGVRLLGAQAAFAALGDQAVGALPELRRMLHDPETTYGAGGSLVSIGPAGVPVLLSALTNTHLKVRRAGLGNLLSLGTNASSAAPAISGLFRDGDAIVRNLAITTYFLIETNKPLLEAQFFQLLDWDETSATMAIRGMGHVGRSGRVSGAEAGSIINRLVQLSTNSSPNLQASGIVALGNWGPLVTNAQAEIIEATRSPLPDVRKAACVALAAMTNDPELVLPILARLATGDGEESVRGSAVSAMAAFGEDAVPYAPQLAEEIRDWIRFGKETRIIQPAK